MPPDAPYWASEDVTLHLGDCLDVLRRLEANSVDAIVTDPPAGVAFMSRAWDTYGSRARFVEWLTERLAEALRVLKPGGHALVWSLPRTAHWTAWAVEDAGFEVRDCVLHLYGSGFPKSLDVSKAIDRQRNDCPDILRVTSWLADAAEAKGVGRAQVDAHMGTSDMGGWWLSRLEHRCAVPTWEQWQQLRALIGFGDEMDAEVWRLNGRKGTPGEAWLTAETLRTEDRFNEPSGIVHAGQGDRSPVTRVIKAANSEDAARWDGWGTALKPGQEMWWLARKPLEGTVAGNVLRWGTGALNVAACTVGNGEGRSSGGLSQAAPGASTYGARTEPDGRVRPEGGRWPANVVLTHSAGCGERCAADCPAAELDRQSDVLTSALRGKNYDTPATNQVYGDLIRSHANPGNTYGDTGGASRFYPVFRYQAKAPASERPRLDDGTAHETVKPLGFISWAIRLITPPGGTVLDLFGGSGPVAEACIIEGFRAVVIERERKSADLIVKRLSKPIQPVMFSLDAS